MTQLERLKIRLGDEIAPSDNSKNPLLTELLDVAEQDIMNKLYPFGTTIETLDESGNVVRKEPVFEERYRNLQVELALIMYNMMGVEGQTAHSENGVVRNYTTYSSLLRHVVPKPKVFG